MNNKTIKTFITFKIEHEGKTITGNMDIPIPEHLTGMEYFRFINNYIRENINIKITDIEK